MENRIKYWLLLVCCAILTGCNLKFPHDITLSPKKLTDSIDGLPQYAPRDQEVTFSIMCQFDSVMVVKTGSKKPVKIIPSRTIGNTCTFLMPAHEVTVIVFSDTKTQPQQPENVVVDNTPAPETTIPAQPVNNPVVAPTPTPHTPVNRPQKPKNKIDSVTVRFNLCLEGVYGRAVDLSGFSYTCKVAKGQNVDMSIFAPRVKPEVTDVKFLGWASYQGSTTYKTTFNIDRETTLYAVWQLPKPPAQIEGTPQNPIKITCLDDLKKMENSDKCFELATDDIIISSAKECISKFQGTFNGNNHRLTISSNLKLIKENRGIIKDIRLHIKKSGCMLCNTNRGTIEGITIFLEKDIRELKHPVIAFTNKGRIARITRTWSVKNVKEQANLLWAVNN